MPRIGEISALIARLHASNIHVQLVDEQLRVSGPDRQLTTDLLKQLKDRKADIVNFLKKHAGQHHLAIPLIEEQYYYKASSSQRRLWLLHQQEEGKTTYNMVDVYRMKGNLEVVAMDKAVRHLIVRHESLRTTFCYFQGEIRQCIRPPENIPMPIIYQDISGKQDQESFLDNCLNETAMMVFDLEEGPLFQIRLIRLSNREYVFCLNMHHIISDGWSMKVLLGELQYLYSQYASDKKPVLSPLPVQYKEFTAWQQQTIIRLGGDHHTYWRQQLSGEIPVLALPTDAIRPMIRRYSGSSKSLLLDGGLSEDVYLLGRQTGTGTFMVLIAVLNTLLFRYTTQTDIIIGTPVSGRDHIDLEQQVGCYTNTLALRCRFSGKYSFRELLQEVKSVVLSAYAHQQYPFDQLVEEFYAGADRSRNPLFDIMVSFKKEEDITANGLKGLALLDFYWKAQNETTKFDLLYEFTESKRGISVILYYNKELFEPARIDNMLTHFQTLLRTVVSDADQPLQIVDFLGSAEKERLLVNYNATACFYPHVTLKHLIEDQFIKTPGNTAVRYKTEQLSYKELHETSNQLARMLQTLGVGADTLVPICMYRSIDMIISILAVLKAGGAYVPIDPGYPVSRVCHILEDTNAGLVICNSSSHTVLSQMKGVRCYNLDEEWACIKTMDTCNVITGPGPGDAAYVIYTSGSTGNPKGVVIEHQAIVNRLLWMQSYFRLTYKDRVLHKTTFCFDVSVWELLWPLCTGAELVIAEPEGHYNNSNLKKLIDQEEVTVIHFVPSMLEVFLSDLTVGDCQSLKRVLCSGESLKVNHVRSFQEKLRHADLYNLYGPTEAAIDVSCCHLPSDADRVNIVPIGKPVSNTRLFVLDSTGRLVPQGFAGSLYIGGTQLARGYLNDPEKTAAKFIEHDYGRLYDTGDVSRWLWDGNLAFLGRDDDQVKIRGQRIELGEVTAALVSHPDVKDGIVVAQMEQGELMLVGYVIWMGDGNEVGLRTYMHGCLPAYMHPVAYVSLTTLPLTTSGKIDKRRLPRIEAVYKGIAYEPAGNEQEVRMVRIWEEVFRRQVGVLDDFFELGGHSLKGIKLASLVYKEFGVQIELKTIFRFPNIRALCKELRQHEQLLHYPGKMIGQSFKVSVNGSDFYATTYAEEYWMNKTIDRRYKEVNKKHGLMSVILELKGPLDIPALNKAVQWIVGRHECLRATFHQIDGKYMMKITSAENFKHFPEYMDVSQLSRQYTTEVDRFIYFDDHWFNFGKGPLFLVRLLKCNSDHYKLSIRMHHVISDTWSLEILVRDLFTAYQSFKSGTEPGLPALEYQFKEYLSSVIQYKKLHGQQHREYWRKLYPLLPDELIIPVAVKDRNNELSNGITNSWGGSVSGTTYQQMKIMAGRFSASMFVILQAAFKSYLNFKTGQNDIVIGTYIHGRSHAGSYDQVGFYARTMLIRTVFEPENGFEELVKKVKKANHDMLEYDAFTLIEWMLELLPSQEYLVGSFWKIDLHYVDSGGYHVNRSVFNDIMREFEVAEMDDPSRHFVLKPGTMQLTFFDSGEKIDIQLLADGHAYDRLNVNDMMNDFLSYVQEMLIDN